MAKTHRKFLAQEKVAILRRHFLERVPFDYYCRIPKEALPRYPISRNLGAHELRAELPRRLATSRRIWLVLSHERSSPLLGVLRGAPWAKLLDSGPKAMGTLARGARSETGTRRRLRDLLGWARPAIVQAALNQRRSRHDDEPLTPGPETWALLSPVVARRLVMASGAPSPAPPRPAMYLGLAMCQRVPRRLCRRLSGVWAALICRPLGAALWALETGRS